MRVSAFTFLRNASMLGYPFIESIRSALPLVDEFVVVVGHSDDDTRAQVEAIGDPRIRIIDSTWNQSIPFSGFVLAQQKMIAQFNCTGDWAIYIEGDEVLHEDDLPALRASMEKHLGNPAVEALYVDFLHFYGGSEWLGNGHIWYKQEARIVRNNLRSVTSDSLYFLIMTGKKQVRYPRAASAGARYFHYGHCRAPQTMVDKQRGLRRIDQASDETIEAINLDTIYLPDARLLKRFQGTHPQVIRKWLAHSAAKGFAPVPRTKLSGRMLRNLIGIHLSRLTGIDLSRRHFRRVD